VLPEFKKVTVLHKVELLLEVSKSCPCQETLPTCELPTTTLSLKKVDGTLEKKVYPPVCKVELKTNALGVGNE